jgi:Protein of unknown function (DUF4238)
MSKKEQKKKNHHKQPQFYLKGFATQCDCPTTPREHAKSDRSIWVYEKGKQFLENQSKRKENNPRCEGIENTAFAEYFYAFTEEDGTRNTNKYEDLLEQQFERPAKTIIEKIRQFEEINEEEKLVLSKYVASMITRGDWYRQKQKEIKENGIAKIKLRKELKNQNDIIDERAKVKFSGDYFLKDLINKANIWSEDILGMNLHFLNAPKGLDFFTSDNPVYLSKHNNEIGNIFMPLASNITFWASRENLIPNPYWSKKSESFFEVEGETVEMIRSKIALSALNEVYYSKKAEWLVKFINNRNNN